VGIENFSIPTTLTHVALSLGTQIPKIHNYAKSHHGGNGDALFELRDGFNTGWLVKGEGYVPGKQGVVIYLNGQTRFIRAEDRLACVHC